MLKRFIREIREALAEPKPDEKPDTSELDALNERYDKSVQHLKDTAKWILGVFAAVAGALLAGLQFTNLGKVEPNYFIPAVLGYGIGLSAVLGIIWLAVNVVMGGTVTEATLLQYSSRKAYPPDIELNDPLLLDGYETVAAFLKDYKEIGIQYESARQQGDKTKVTALEPKKTRLVTTFKYFRPVARFAIVLRSFHSAVIGMFILAALAAITIGIFTWSTSRVTITNTVFQEPPSAVSITLTEAGKRALKEALGTQCVEQDAISGILLSVDSGAFDVVSIPSDICKVAKFTVDADTGSLLSSNSSTPATSPPAAPTPANATTMP